MAAGKFAGLICGNRQTCYTQYKYGTTLLAEKNAIFQCELLKVGKKSRKIHGRGSENLPLGVAIYADN